MCLLSGWYVASENEELKFLFYLILANLDLSIHSWLVANVLDNTGLEGRVKSSLCSLSILCKKGLP